MTASECIQQNGVAQGDCAAGYVPIELFVFIDKQVKTFFLVGLEFAVCSGLRPQQPRLPRTVLTSKTLATLLPTKRQLQYSSQ